MRPRTTGLRLSSAGTIALFALLAVSSAVSCRGARSGPEAELPEYGTVPDFSLLDAAGKTVSRGDLVGEVWIADFIFTRCAGACPSMTAKMGWLQSALEASPGGAARGSAGSSARRIRLVTFTVDPDNDTPQILRGYAAAAGARSDRWLFLTGGREAIRKLSERGFKLSAETDPQAAATLGGPAVTHSQKFVLVDQESRIRGYYDGTDEDAVRRLARDARSLAGGA